MALTPRSGAIVVDTSALMACMLDEAGSEALLQRALAASATYMSSVTHVELGIVALQRNVAELATPLLRLLRVDVVAFDAEHARRAVDAFKHWGKGRHRAGLNFGDCCTYALAACLALPLLYVGQDFTRTDVVAALPTF